MSIICFDFFQETTSSQTKWNINISIPHRPVTVRYDTTERLVAQRNATPLPPICILTRLSPTSFATSLLNTALLLLHLFILSSVNKEYPHKIMILFRNICSDLVKKYYKTMFLSKKVNCQCQLCIKRRNQG